MKRCGSDWCLDDFLGPEQPQPQPPPAGEAGEVVDALDGFLLPGPVQKLDFADVYCDDLGFEFGNRETINNQIWPHKNSSISPTFESHSSICAGSPILSHKPKGTENQTRGGTSDSDQSDDESLDIEAGSFEHGTGVTDLKRMRRMVSNRESARRSRKKKQAHLADLEFQVDQLRGENSTLFKQLTDANQQFGHAVTDNRVLKSDVEALRVKVKMAEDLVTRGSLACGLDHLLQNQVGSNQSFNARNICRASEILPIIELQADDTCYISASPGEQVQNIGMGNNEIKNENNRIQMNQNSPLQSIVSIENPQSRISSEVTSCWSWNSPTNVMSKQL